MTRITNYALKTAAVTEPLTLTETKLHLKVDDTADDELIRSLISAARQHVEDYTGRALVTQTWYGYADSLCGTVQITKCPVQSITSIKYVDGDGDTQTWSSTEYESDLSGTPARVIEADGYSFPTTATTLNAWTIEFVSGYGYASDVPAAIRSAMLLLIGHWYEHRMSVIIGSSAYEVPQAVTALLTPYIVWR